MDPVNVLKTEIDGDPLARGYAGMTDVQVFDDLNTEYRSLSRPTITSAELYQAIDDGEYIGLNNAGKARVDQILGLGGEIDATPGSRARAVILALFGAGTTTRANLVALVDTPIDRGRELLGRKAKLGWVQEARK